MKLASNIMLGVGAIVGIVGYSLISSSNYGLPPIPSGWAAAMIFIIFGGASVLSGLSLIFHSKVHSKYTYVSASILGATILGIGIRTLIYNPLETPACPCPTGYWGPKCLPCTCVNGICDDGGEGTGVCLCDMGWGGDRCNVCSETFQGATCNECKRGWWTETCNICAPGYTGAKCDSCDSKWITESDDLGTLCRSCKPSHFGGYCKICPACNTYDSLAICRDNDWHDDNIYTGERCTSNAQICTNKYDCKSFNCKGICVDGDETTGQLCEFDTECTIGTCQYKTCCLEQQHGDGECECKREGYWGPLCEKCPGFDGVYSATICTGHGTCAAAYSKDTFSHLQCECSQEGTEPFPSWSGTTCGCLKESSTSTTCNRCADGFFGEKCTSCPGGGGISQCNMHGTCSDGVSGNGQCTCDVDIKYGGLGGWMGSSCDSCMGEFWGPQCKTCPAIMEVGCQAGFTEIPGTGNCLVSCGGKTCNGGICE